MSLTDFELSELPDFPVHTEETPPVTYNEHFRRKKRMARWSSRMAVAAGIAATALFAVAIFGPNWTRTKEELYLTRDRKGTVAFEISLWEVCPDFPKDNITDNYVMPKNQKCVRIPYKYTPVDSFEGMPAWENVVFASHFVNRMRICTPFGCVALGFLMIGVLCSCIGHFRRNICTMIACGLYIFGGILIGSKLLVYASILSDTFLDSLATDNVISVDYHYGWSFICAIFSLAFAKLAVVFAVTSHMYKYDSVEEMVRAMVPGADRRLQQHISSERLLHAPELVPPPAPYRDSDQSNKPDLCEAEDKTSPIVVPIQRIRGIQNQSRFKTLSGREPRYAAPPRAPAQFYSLPRKHNVSQKPTNFGIKSAV